MKIIIRTLSGVDYSTGDNVITVSYKTGTGYSSSDRVEDSPLANISPGSSFFHNSWYNESTTRYSISNRKAGSFTFLQGDKVESVTMVD